MSGLSSYLPTVSLAIILFSGGAIHGSSSVCHAFLSGKYVNVPSASPLPRMTSKTTRTRTTGIGIDTIQKTFRTTFLGVSRYGPPTDTSSSVSSPDGDGEGKEDKKEPSKTFDRTHTSSKDRKEMFRKLLDEALSMNSNLDHLPRLIANNMNVIVSMETEESAQIIKEFIETNDSDSTEESQYTQEQRVDVVDTILEFVENFVQEANSIDTRHKRLLGKIIKFMTSYGPNPGMDYDEYEDDTLSVDDFRHYADLPAREREIALDGLIENERDNFTPGFLKYLEGECHRLSSAKRTTRETVKMLEIVSTIHTRVLEEIGKDLGEAALVLGQLIGYDSQSELLGVLEAGLAVRGVAFAQEMARLTAEALDGFERVPGGADPDLVDRVRSIDRRLHNYLGEDNTPAWE